MWQKCSKTLLLLQPKVPPLVNETLCAALIGNIITTAVTSHPSMLQIALGLLARAKKISHQLYVFGACASYDEIRRYKISAAETTNFSEVKLSDKKGLIQGVCDNYDTNVTSQNGFINNDFLD